MRAIETKAEGEQQPDGSFTVTITVSGFSGAKEASVFSEAMRVSVREAVVRATKATSFDVQDMTERSH